MLTSPRKHSDSVFAGKTKLLENFLGVFDIFAPDRDVERDTAVLCDDGGEI